MVRKAVVKRSELTDGAWERIAPHLPSNGRRGKQWKDHRTVVNGILWKLRTGAPWRDLPERYGSWQTCYDRFVLGDATGRGTGSWPERRRRPTRWARLSGRSASTALLPGRISTRPAPAAGRDAKTQKGGRAPRGRGAWAQPGRVEHEGAFGLRRAGAPTLGGRDAGPATREHATRGRARRHPGGASGRWEATQASEETDRRQGLLVPELPEDAVKAWHHAHDSRAARPTRSAHGAPGSQAGLRCERLPATQRSRALRQPAQTVAWDRHPVREAGAQLPGYGSHRRADGLAGLMNHQTCPSLIRRGREVSPSGTP